MTEKPVNRTEPPDEEQIRADVRRALAEDIGAGDLTAQLIPANAVGEAVVISREAAVLCGRPWFEACFRELDPAVTFQWAGGDGARIAAGQDICTLRGAARALLTGERTALNFLQTLSGTATLSRHYRERVSGLSVSMLDTRKTLPGLRAAQKYAVRCGGCDNHRMGLYDGILIKENHIAACGSITKAIENARIFQAGLPIEVEVEDLDEAAEALSAGADILLLDNFGPEDLRRAVALNRRRARLEASGGVTIDNIRAIAATGVDAISVGALTKDLRAVDFSMRLRFDR